MTKVTRPKTDVSSIRITDPFTLRVVESEQKRNGESTATKTAMRLIAERLRELDLERQYRPAPGHGAGETGELLASEKNN